MHFFTGFTPFFSKQKIGQVTQDQTIQRGMPKV
jgi:hypothetical protein